MWGGCGVRGEGIIFDMQTVVWTDANFFLPRLFVFVLFCVLSEAISRNCVLIESGPEWIANASDCKATQDGRNHRGVVVCKRTCACACAWRGALAMSITC